MQRQISRRQALKGLAGLVGFGALGTDNYVNGQYKRYSREEIVPNYEEFEYGYKHPDEDTALKRKLRLAYQNPSEAFNLMNETEKHNYSSLVEDFYPKRIDHGFLGGLGSAIGRSAAGGAVGKEVHIKNYQRIERAVGININKDKPSKNDLIVMALAGSLYSAYASRENAKFLDSLHRLLKK